MECIHKKIESAVFFPVDLIVVKCQLVLKVKIGGLDHPKDPPAQKIGPTQIHE